MSGLAHWGIGVTMATSGPGAKIRITGNARSAFDRIPSTNITVQVNPRESSAVHVANAQRSGFQETKIVDVVKPLTKNAVLVRTVGELRDGLAKSHEIATSGSKCRFLIDVTMDFQQAEMDVVFFDLAAPDPGLMFGQIPCKPQKGWHTDAEIKRRTSLDGFTQQVGRVDGLSRTIDWNKAAQTGLLA